MAMKDIAELGFYVVGSLGGGTVLIGALVRWWGKYLAESLLEGERAYHRQDLERLKRDLEATNRQFQAELDKTVHAFKAKLQIEIHAILDLWKKTSEAQTAMQILRPEMGIVQISGDRELDAQRRNEEFQSNFSRFTMAHNSLLDAYRAQSVFVTEKYSGHMDRVLRVTGTEIKQIQLADMKAGRDWYEQGKQNYAALEQEVKALSQTIRERLDELVLTERQQG